ncbi:MAG: response regulator [Gammaproteobacteria bacterium]|nr:response regulator [Gammaproteobacteria bacterium]MDJ0870911.1 response regulator [Gammaproteobacteria bacterium]MDJ0890348.1 response regulator [Gammaproteobacteria bacterium]
MLENDTALVVDLSAEVREYVASILRHQFHCRRILSAGSRNDLLEILGSGTERLDWIFFDWELPGMQPTEFLQEVQRHPGSRGAAVIMMTRHREKSALHEILQAGASDYLIKPFTLSILLFKVRRISLSEDRRTGERLRVHASQEIDLRFSKGTKLAATLLSISPTGCLARAPAFSNRLAQIYDEAQITLQTEEGAINLQGELVRMEGDRSSQSSQTHILTAFRFRPLSTEATKRLSSFMASIGPPLPTDWENT